MQQPFESISIIGLGYIGPPTAAVFASRKIQVIDVGVNQQAADAINRSEIHIVEPDQHMIVHAAVKEGYLRATTQTEAADAFLIAVPTPFKQDIDDLRASPSPEIALKVAAEHQGTVSAIEPNISALTSAWKSKLDLTHFAGALEHADIFVLFVDHNEFKATPQSRFDFKSWVDCKGLIPPSHPVAFARAT